ncbi:MAG: GDP-mannose 4,6-dehydratase [Candidatus Staskawiczbacteria bacterium RIFCSPHIGHO2_02_FULL_34_10]|uniref:GDP-mannose 4,6-dehydratase n=2 Tax=Candidatus Staskawicziibacteriota TaxID=1817916 RepID=A0A1G2HKC2_9BACT|nr:MAG: GDP-mannose 4,6-dehydratase [Candidatus Staskawiczbacteria bacterium RIFCSPHIGHO2_01_FULL_34_27]OGZ67274.1 MAG: GDP-mannose 4,6-dehydratase [Candidatus Staskawiczbacteria bacterium RIFCSPHIGHO2_02_FULL_34_10]
MKILITGITGFVGSHLAEYCLSRPNVKLYGTFLVTKEIKNLEHIKNKITFLKCDLTKKEQVKNVILKVKPDKIFHLAGQSQVSSSFQSPEKTLFNNIVSDVNLFEAIKNIKINPVIVIAGSSEEYGAALKNELPIKESNELRPLSPYAVSKITQEKLAFQYYQSYGLKAVLMRFFNTEGPRRGEHFVASSFAKQIAEIEKGKKEPIIFAGNLEAKRDFIDVRDVVMAYWLASEKCKFGDPYNVCSGKARSIKSVLTLLLSLSKVKNIEVRQDPKRMRPSDISVVVGDNSKFKQQTGWKPKIPFEKTMEDLLNYWRENV